MKYTIRDLRSADMLSLILIGVGAFLAVRGVLVWLAADDAPEATNRLTETIWWGLPASVTLLLGTALQLKVRELTRTGGQEPDEYPGVPE